MVQQDSALIESILQKALVCHLALAVNGEPYLAPVCFGYDDRHIYFHSGPGGKKLEMLAINPRVCFELETDVEVLPNDSPCRFSMRYRSIIGYGVAVRLVEADQKRAGLDAIIRQYGGTPGEVSPEALNGVEVYAVVIDRLTCKQHRIDRDA